MLEKLERKFGKYAIHNFSYYILMISAIGCLLGLIAPQIYNNYLSLNFDMVLKGQVWRLLTFVLYPQITSVSVINIIFAVLSLFLYYYIGKVLEETWGAFRFNIYYISGFLLNIISSLILYLIFDVSYSFGMTYINYAMFLAFATIMPNNTIYLYGLIPIKMKYLGWIYAFVIGYEVITNLFTLTPSGIAISVAIIVSILNFIIYFIASKRKYKVKKPKVIKPKKIDPKTAAQKAQAVADSLPKKKLYDLPIEPAEERCTTCGRFKKEHPELEFRYCSKCNGTHLYCNEHLFTHEHKK